MEIPTQIVNGRFHVHGLFHDSLRTSLPIEYKKNVARALNRKDVICEDGFSYWILNSASFNEREYFELNKVNLKDIAYFFYQNFRRKKQLTLEEIPEIIKQRERCYTKRSGELIEAIENESDLTQLPLSFRRYIFEAQEAIKYAEEKALNELHVVVGKAHELSLVYLLNNPEKIQNRNI